MYLFDTLNLVENIETPPFTQQASIHPYNLDLYLIHDRMSIRVINNQRSAQTFLT